MLILDLAEVFIQDSPTQSISRLDGIERLNAYWLMDTIVSRYEFINYFPFLVLLKLHFLFIFIEVHWTKLLIATIRSFKWLKLIEGLNALPFSLLISHHSYYAPLIDGYVGLWMCAFWSLEAIPVVPRQEWAWPNPSYTQSFGNTCKRSFG